MSLRTLGTTSTTALQALSAWSAVLSAADVAAISEAIVSDQNFASILGGYGAGPTAVLATGATHSNTTLDTLVSISGAPISQINVGDLVLGVGIPAGTFVAAISGTTVTLSQAATTTVAIRVVFVRQYRVGGGSLDSASARLVIPDRGVLKVLPGDVAALDNLGWPILISGASIGYAGSQWNLV